MPWLRNNWRLKLFSLFLAVVAWVSLSGQLQETEGRQRERSFEGIPVQIVLGPGDPGLRRFAISLEPAEVDVILRGPRDRLSVLTTEELMAVVDLTSVEEPGVYTLPIRLALPPSVEPVGLVRACTVTVAKARRRR